MHTVILLRFYRCFCMCVDFYYLPFRHSSTGPMTLPTDAMQQLSSLCGPVQLGELKGVTPYHSLLDYTFSFNLLGVIFYTPVCERMCLWYPTQLWQGMHFKFGKGVGTKIS